MSFFTQIRILGNVGGIVDAALGTAKPANAVQVGGNDGTNLFAIPLASGGGSVVVSGSATVSGTITANQGTAAASTAPWYIRESAPTTANWTQSAINFSASGANVIVAASGSTTVRIMRIFFVNSDSTLSTNITIQDTTPTSFSGAFRLASGGSFGADCNGEPLFVSASGKGIQLNSSVAVQISGVVWYTQS